MVSIVVMVSPGLDPRTSPPETATGGRADAVAGYSLPLVALGRYDVGAVRLAIALGERRGEDVVAVSLGGDGAEAALRRALAYGATVARRIVVPDPESLDSASTAAIVARAVERLRTAGTIVLGSRGGTFETGALPGWLAHELGVDLVPDLPSSAVEAVPEDLAIVSVHELPSSSWPLPAASRVLAAHGAEIGTLIPEEMEVDLSALRAASTLASGIVREVPVRAGSVYRDEPLPALAERAARLVLTRESDG